MGHRQDMTDKQRLDWDSWSYKRKLEESKGHNYQYHTDDLEKKWLANGYDFYEFKDGKEATSSENIAIKAVEALRADNHYARIICGRTKVVQKIKYFSVIFKKKK